MSPSHLIFSHIFTQLQPSIHAYIARRIEPGAVEDVTQRVFLRAWRRFATVAEPIESPRNYLYRSAHNAVIDHYRRRERDRTIIALDDISEGAAAQPPEQEQTATDNLDREWLRRKLSHLPPAQREIMRHRFLEHRSIDEVCRLTGKSPNAISVLTARAKRRLQALS